MKTGRNNPCPCGSGKKYKKCCFGIDEGSQKKSEHGELANTTDSIMQIL